LSMDESKRAFGWCNETWATHSLFVRVISSS